MNFKKRPITVKPENTFKDKVFFWKGIPVCITVQLAEFYECNDRNITQNFNRNKEKFKIKKNITFD